MQSNTIQFQTDTSGDSEKRVMLPFLGFYPNYIELINQDISDYADSHDMSDKQHNELAKNYDYNTHLNLIAEAYVDYLNQELSDMLETTIKLVQPDTHEQTILSSFVEFVSAVVNVDQLPSVDLLQKFCSDHQLIDFKKNLQTIASHDLRMSDQDITGVLNKPYKFWQSIHIECLLKALVQVVQVNKTGKESANWLHDINSFEAEGFLDYAAEKNLFEVNIAEDLS